jgi:hypothetical protein
MERPGGASTIGVTNSREEAKPPHPDVSAALWWFDRRSGAGQTGGGLRTGVSTFGPLCAFWTSEVGKAPKTVLPLACRTATWFAVVLFVLSPWRSLKWRVVTSTMLLFARS